MKLSPEQYKKLWLLFIPIMLFVIATMCVLTFATPANTKVAYAEIEYEFTLWDLESEQWEAYFMCKNCEAYFKDTISDPDDYESVLSEFEDWELSTPYCIHCWEGHLCGECHNEPEGPGRFCEDCSLCIDHWDDSIHCHQCGSCVEDLCQDCLAAEGWHICTGCHTEASHCPGCGVCMYPLYEYGDVCMDYGEPHCVFCDEEWICNECGECFFNYHENFCSECGVCISCGVAAGLHCRYCDDCFGDATGCEGNEGVCLDCCIELGNHCEHCDEHVDNWCRGGMECGHCHDCASSQGWLCDRCGYCEECDGFSRCDTCGDCDECCQARAEARGCVCLVYCVEDSSFEDEEHRCPSCHNFFCEVERCDDCGLCIECCLANSEAEGCECGICIESGDFEDHLCDNCGLPFCTQGDPCDDCGLCQECCLDASSSAGCSCGLCVESDDFSNPDHLCDQCQENFSCNVSFCDECGLCEECCAQNAWDEYECDHGVCIESNEWDDHYCDVCGKCKEDCLCGEDCCADPYNDPTDTHGSPVPVGTVLKQPTNRTRTVSKNTKTERADNLVSFTVRAYDPKSNVTYQWYVKRGNEEAVALVDESEYLVSKDETLVFVGGATTNNLIVAVPCDACLVSYSYYCVTTTAYGDTFTSESASLIGKHNYGYVWTSENGHSHGCVGCGYIDSSTEKKHEIGPWRYARYATATEGALVVRECRVCGGVAESHTTEPLGDHPYHTYIYQPVYKTDSTGKYVTDDNGAYISLYHEKRCLCGRKSGQDEEHVYSAWIVTKPADEKHTGSKYHDCAVCNYREVVTIKKQTHDHAIYFDSEESPTGVTSATGYDSKYHWAKCIYSDCNAVGLKEEHQFDDWHIRDIPYNFETETNRLVWRTCKVCGYTETKEIKSGSKALVFTNAAQRAQAVDNWQGEFSVHTATAKPPKGYYFDHWEVVVDGDFTAEELFDFDQFYWKKTKRADGTVRSDRVYTNIYSETIAFKLIHHYDDSYNIVYHLKAVCYRYDNQLLVYPDDDKDDRYYLSEGDTIATNYDPDAPGVAPEDSVVWVEKVEEEQYGWVIYYDGADRGPRTMTVHLNGYRGGPIEVTSFEQDTLNGLPCNLHIIVDKDSVIRTSGSAAIWGCPFGGDVIISSTTGATLTISVSGLNPYSGEMYGIHTDRAKLGFSDKVSFQGNVKVNIAVTNQGSGYSQTDVAYGIYSESQVEVLDNASLKAEAISWDHGTESKATTALAIYAKKELRIDTTGNVELIATGVMAGKKGLGVKTKYVYVDSVNHFYIDYNTDISAPYNAKPQYNAKIYISYVIPMTDKNRNVIEPGHRVTLNIEEKDGVPTAIIDVHRWYTDEEGYYLVRDGEDFYFTVTPALGYYDPKVREIGGISVNPYGTVDGVREQYVVCDVNEDFTLNIYGGYEFRPYASQPAVSRRNVYYESDAILSYRLNATDAIYYHSLIGGEKSNDPKFRKKMTDLGYDVEVVTTNFTIDRVFLQRYNEVTNTYKNTGIDFAVSAVGNVTFNDSTKNVGKTVRYRLMIVFDGAEYASEPFSVTWTENQEDMPEKVVNMVELFVAHAGSYDFEGGKFDGGDARIRLDAEHPYYYYTVATGKSYVGNALDIFHSQKRGENPITVAEFDYHTGVLTFYGTTYAVDFNNDGVIRTEDGERGNLDGEILGIRVSDDSAEGGLIINVAGNTTIGGCCDDYGWVGANQLYVADSVINNEYGFVRIKSNINAELDIIRTSKSHEIEGILAMGDVYLEGDVIMKITLGVADDITVSADADRYGIYSCANVIMREEAGYYYTGTVENRSKCLKGESVAVFAENGSLTMLGDAYAIICSGAKYKDIHGDYNAICVERLNVVQNAWIDLRTSGDVNVPVFASDGILLATTAGVWIRSTSDPSESYGVSCGNGTFEVRYPTTLVYENEYNRDLMKEGDEDKFILTGRYTHYHKLGFDKYFPGDSYVLSVTTDKEMEHYFSQYDYEIKEPDTTLLTSGFHYKGYTQSVRAGDSVTYLAKEAKHGYTFGGWKYSCAIALPDLSFAEDGREISFTMPGYDVVLYPIYTCTAFDEEPACLVVTERESRHATLYWRIDASTNLQSARLEKLNAKGKWVELDWNLVSVRDGALANGMKRFWGEQALKVAGAEGDGREIADYGTYRIHAVSDDGYFAGYDLYSEAFVIDFLGGVHLLVPTSNSADDVLTIPSGYAGTDYVLYLGDCIYSDNGMTYTVAFRDLLGNVSPDLCEVKQSDKTVTFIRKDAMNELQAIAGGTYITAVDNATGREFRIPYTFGEILASTVYPLAVSGQKVHEHNADDILGDGTVSYNNATKTLTLNNATINKLYAETTDGALQASGYGILCVEDITINLVGSNVIDVGPKSVCVNSDAFGGNIIAIGNVTTEAWRALTTGANYRTITFTGTGSLTINISGQDSYAVYGYGHVNVNGCKLSINAENYGVTVERGGFGIGTDSAADVTIDCEVKSAIWVKYSANNFSMFDGKLRISGGTDDYAIRLGNVENDVYIAKGKAEISTKSATYDLTNGSFDYDGYYFRSYNSVDGKTYVEGVPDKTAKSVKLSRDVFIWVNGKRITPEQLTVVCGQGTATYDPETRILTLKNATINNGISYYSSVPYTSGIYVEEPVVIELVGSNTIDLSKYKDYDPLTGEEVGPLTDEEEESLRRVFGIHVAYVVSHSSHGYDDRALTLFGDGTLKITGIREGIETFDPVILEGAKVEITDCECGISAGGGLALHSGNLRIETSIYAIYGDIAVGEELAGVRSVFGSEEGDVVRLTLADLIAEYGNDWGLEIRNLLVRDYVVDAGITSYHDWNATTYVWSEDGTKLTATRVCKNDPTHVETETVSVTSEVTKQPTCTAVGETTYTSAFFSNPAFSAKQKVLANVPALGHTAGEWIVTKDATCTEKGSKHRLCTVCNEELDVEDIDALGHDLVHHDAKAATCTGTGWDAYDTCSRCDYTTYIEISALGHDLVHHDAKAATCTGTGWNAYDTCSRCDHTTYVEIAALGHTFGEWTVTQAPQAGVKGEETRTCSKCGATEKRDIAALPYVPTTKEDGTKVYNETVTEKAKDLTELFTQAKAEEGTVEIRTSDVVIVFDNSAVSAIGGAEVSISARVITEDSKVENAELVLEVTLTGTTFESGSATVSVPFERDIPEGKVPKVYYIDDEGNRTDMNAVYADGIITFTTNHFSTYAVVFEDEASIVNGLSAGAIAGIVVGAVVLLIAIAAGIVLLKKKKV